MLQGDPKTINMITNILAVILLLAGSLQTYFATQEFSWLGLAVCVITAIISWLTGKSSMKKEEQK